MSTVSEASKLEEMLLYTGVKKSNTRLVKCDGLASSQQQLQLKSQQTQLVCIPCYTGRGMLIDCTDKEV